MSCGYWEINSLHLNPPWPCSKCCKKLAPEFINSAVSLGSLDCSSQWYWPKSSHNDVHGHCSWRPSHAAPPVTQIRKPRLRMNKWHTQGHPAGKYRTRVSKALGFPSSLLLPMSLTMNDPDRMKRVPPNQLETGV